MIELQTDDAVSFSRSAADAMVRRAMAGDDDGFDALVAATKHEAFALAFRWTRDRETSFEVVQDAYVKFYRQLGKWNFSCHVKTWLYRVITNSCIDLRRRRRPEVISFDAVDNPAELEQGLARDADDPSQQLHSSERRQALESCIGQLPERMQQVVRLRYAGGLSLQEIADVQSCSVGTVKATLHQANRKLRSLLTAH